MLNEYHDLYEMQRCRLEATVAQLTYDQELWLQATYELSWRVAEEYDLRTLQRLQLSEKAWCKLAGHFAILLNSRDSKQVRVCVGGEGGEEKEGTLSFTLVMTYYWLIMYSLRA